MKRNYLLILASVLTPLLVSGQSYYDDDIYYNPSKVKKTEKREVKKQKTEETADFEEPTYQVYTSNPRDVDEYNRRGAYKVSADTISADTVVANPDVFQYTERMERFDNPTIVVSSDDSRLKELYYADNVNIYVGTPSVTWSIGGFYDPWYRSSWYYNSWDWSFGWGCYRPYYGWYDPFWGPSYPYYGWGYGWSYPHYYPYYPYYPGGHHYYSDGGRRPFSASDRPSTTYSGYRGGSTTYTSPSTNPGRRPAVSTERTTPSYSSPSRSTDRTPSYRQPSTSSPSRGSSFGGFRGGSSSGGRGSFSGGGRGGRR